jgi:hypothetical protein
MKKSEIEMLSSRVLEEADRLHPEVNKDFLLAVIEAEENNPQDERKAISVIEDALGNAMNRGDGATNQ